MKPTYSKSKCLNALKHSKMKTYYKLELTSSGNNGKIILILHSPITIKYHQYSKTSNNQVELVESDTTHSVYKTHVSSVIEDYDDTYCHPYKFYKELICDNTFVEVIPNGQYYDFRIVKYIGFNYVMDEGKSLYKVFPHQIKVHPLNLDIQNQLSTEGILSMYPFSLNKN